MGNALEVNDLTVTYNQKPVLWNIGFSIPEGKMTGIIGPNGSGKTTLLKSIMGLIEPDGGSIKVFSDKLDNVRQRVSYVPQRESVDWDFPISVMEVVGMGRYTNRNIFGRQSKEDANYVLEALEKVKLLEFKDRQISQLSGGQQQRVFIARALVQHADLYILDEPFAGVDAASESAIFDLLIQMKDEGKNVLVVHHDLQSAAKFFEYMIMLNTRLVAAGPSQEVFNEANLESTYGGQLNILNSIGEQLKKKSFPIRE
jgi:manganese/zinc/iron transport system ATP- binding protein